MRYNHQQIAVLRRQGWSWPKIIVEMDMDTTADALRSLHSKWARRNQPRPLDDTIRQIAGEPTDEPDEATHDLSLSGAEMDRIESLEDLVRAFGADPEEWEIKKWWPRGSSWDAQAKGGTVRQLHSYRISAQLDRKPDVKANEALARVEQAVADMEVHAPTIYVPMDRVDLGGGNPVLAEIDIFDPHLGMLAYGPEVNGEHYDLRIGRRDFVAAADHLLSLAHLYRTERILLPVGNDFLHVDGWAQDGSRRGGATAAGTPQDTDGRVHKIRTEGRRALVEVIDHARQIAPVDVLVVPGNHDTDSMYMMGEVLSAWYRNDAEVDVTYGPQKRFFYGYGDCGFLFTHGEETKRKRDNLPTIFLDECPIDILAACRNGTREVHTGHQHVAKTGGYYPEAELTESRAVRVRSLPGLTATDSWHYLSGYRHRRAATGLFWYKGSGLAGHHEFSL